MMLAFHRKVSRMTNPNNNPKKQSLKEWAMAGGGVPREYEGRAYEWHKKVQQFAAGGGIKPAAYIDGNEFVEAAQAYGLKTDNATLNKIVDRVNKGESVREAAKNVAESHAAGGEIFNTVPDMKDGGQIIDGPAYAKGGDVHMSAGGMLAKAIKGAKKAQPAAEAEASVIKVPAPNILIPSKINSVKEAVRQSKGGYGARRVERAADEIPNLDRLFSEEGLRQAFSGDNAKAVMTMNPADFEKYAAMLHYKNSVGPKAAQAASQGDLSKHTMTTEEYLKYLRTLPEGFDDVPFLQVSKQETGLPLMPYITGHEGRHRNRALAGAGQQKSLVQLMPNYELRESLPRRHQDEYIQALKDEMFITGNKVKPENYFDDSLPKNKLIERLPIELPDFYAKGGKVEKDDEGAAFGVFPQMKGKRSKQDREAAKNVPVDLARGAVAGALGMPGDIESFIRMLPYLDEKTILPTSEDIEKRLPFKSDTPVSRAATGLGTLGGGFYTGPLSGAKAAMAVPKAVARAGRDFVQAAGQPAVNVIKPKGGNWMTGSVEKVLDPLIQKGIINNVNIPYGPEFDAAAMRRIAELKEAASQPDYKGGAARVAEHLERDINNPRRANEAAVNKWIQSNLTNYVKKDMGTPDDPVRKLAEEGISHLPADASMPLNMGAVRETRKEAGFPDPYGQSWRGMLWESKADKPIGFGTAGELINRGKGEPWMEKVDPFTRVHGISPMDSVNFTQDLGFNHIIDVLRQDVAAGRIRPEQLSKVSMEQAVRRTHEFDQEMAKKMAQAQAKVTEGMPTYKEYPEGYKWIQLAPPKELPSGYSTILDDVTGSYKVVDETGQEAFPRKPNKLGHINVPFFKTPDEAIADALKRDPRLEAALKYEGETMGHCVGGYCDDVRDGKSNIFSLRDAKGEPHVTVEVKPVENLEHDYNRWFENQSEEVQNKIAQRRIEDKNYNVYEGPEYLAWAGKNFPSIVQIKGKGNDAPKANYLPFVQDFVRSGKWSDVGDIKNTGLIDIKNSMIPWPKGTQTEQVDRLLGGMVDGTKTPLYKSNQDFFKKAQEDLGSRYISEQEYQDWLAKQISPDVPPIEGMAKGGKAVKEVVELGIDEIKALLGMAKEAPKGVDPIVVKPSERAAAGRKAAELIKSQPQIKASEALGQLKEKGFKKTTTTQADRTRVGGGNIGGAPFSAISEADPLYAGKVWGVMDENTATRLKNLTDPYTAWTTMLGSADQLKTNPIVFDKLKKGFLDAMKEGRLSPELEAKINHNLALNFGEGAQIRDPKIWKEADTFEKRAALADLMMGQGIPPSKGGLALGGEKSGKGVIFKPTDTLIRETEPSLLHPEHGGTAPTFAAGPRFFTMEPSSVYRPDLHPGFPTLLEGKDLNYNVLPTPTEVFLPDWHKAFKEKKPERFWGPWAQDIMERRKGGSYKLGGVEGPGYYDLALGLKGEGLPSQDLTDDYIRHLIREGYKAGGAVGGLSRVTKSCDCHD